MTTEIINGVQSYHVLVAVTKKIEQENQQAIMGNFDSIHRYPFLHDNLMALTGCDLVTAERAVDFAIGTRLIQRTMRSLLRGGTALYSILPAGEVHRREHVLPEIRLTHVNYNHVWAKNSYVNRVDAKFSYAVPNTDVTVTVGYMATADIHPWTIYTDKIELTEEQHAVLKTDINFALNTGLISQMIADFSEAANSIKLK